MSPKLQELVKRLETGPEAAQEELAELAEDIERGVHAGTYYAAPEELADIDRGRADVATGRFAPDRDRGAAR